MMDYIVSNMVFHRVNDKFFCRRRPELLRQINEGDDRLSREKSRQLQLMKLRRDERRARNEDKFDSAALVLGLAEENEKQSVG